MFCSNCGKMIADNAKFCNFCGLPVSNPISQPVSEPISQTLSQPISEQTPVLQPISEQIPISQTVSESTDSVSQPISDSEAAGNTSAPIESIPIPEPISEPEQEAESVPATLPEPPSSTPMYSPTPENIPNTGTAPNMANPVSMTFQPNQPPMYQQPVPQNVPKAPEKPLPERKYTLGHILMCLAAVAVMAIVAGIFAGLYFSVV